MWAHLNLADRRGISASDLGPRVRTHVSDRASYRIARYIRPRYIHGVHAALPWPATDPSEGHTTTEVPRRDCRASHSSASSAPILACTIAVPLLPDHPPTALVGMECSFRVVCMPMLRTWGGKALLTSAERHGRSTLEQPAFPSSQSVTSSGTPNNQSTGTSRPDAESRDASTDPCCLAALFCASPARFPTSPVSPRPVGPTSAHHCLCWLFIYLAHVPRESQVSTPNGQSLRLVGKLKKRKGGPHLPARPS